MADGPLIVQSDRTVLLEVAHPDAESARHELAIFAELERAPEHIHTYRITRLGLWNARAAGHDADDMLATLDRWTALPGAAVGVDRHPRDRQPLRPARDRARRRGHVTRAALDGCRGPGRGLENKRIPPLLIGHPSPDTFVVDAWARGHIKQELLKIGWPAEDRAGYTPGTPHPIELAEDGWHLRPYQRQAVDIFTEGGSGVVVLPCGAGKTLVGAGAMAETKTTTLILVTNTVSARQWRDELLKRTSLTAEEIGEYSGQMKEIKPVTIATYQILTAKRKGEYAHLALLDALDWGLIVYDEVHLLPGAGVQAHRRSAGPPPPRPHRHARARGRPRGRRLQPHRPQALRRAVEGDRGPGLHLPGRLLRGARRPPAGDRLEYAAAADDERYRLAATAPAKIGVVRRLVERHAGERILVIGQYLDQIDVLAEALDAPQITGETPVDEREKLFQAFRVGEISLLVVSKVANFSIDLPEASVAIQVSGSFGSRQEEAQRLGRLLRPKESGNTASFYTLIARDTVDQDFAQNRQRFLAEQGYRYTILDADGIAA